MPIEMSIFSHLKETVSFSATQSIFTEGETGNVMYVVQAGEVDILAGDSLLETIGPGEIFGEMALVGHTSRSATALAKTDCLLIPINEQQFMALIQHTPYFAIQVMRVMAERLRKMNEQVYRGMANKIWKIMNSWGGLG